jgi:hypothetical protein
VYQPERPSTVSNDSTRASPPSVSLNRCACSVPISGPALVGATHVAGGPSIEARCVQAPFRPSQIDEPSTLAQLRAPSTASAVTVWPASASTDLAVSPSMLQRPAPVPTRMLDFMVE